MFSFGKQKHHVVVDFAQACDLLIRMGVEMVRRPSDAKGASSVIVRKNGLNWVFAGDTEIFTLARRFEAPDNWEIDRLQSWLFQKNFIVAVYIQEEKTFIIMTHILVEGGLILQNLARHVYNFDAYITSFLQHMKLDERHIKPLE